MSPDATAIAAAFARLDASTSELRNIDWTKPADLNDLLCLLHEVRTDAQKAERVVWQAKVERDKAEREPRCPRCGSDSVGTVRTSGMSIRIDCGKCHYSGASLA